ncbi:hypothetical protein THAOC_23837, partial [Thalassiosira oceanica]
LQSLVL